MIIRLAEGGGFVRVNRSFADRVGYGQEELAQRPLEDWLPEEDRQIFRDALADRESCCRIRHRAEVGPPLALDLRLQYTSEGAMILGRCSESARPALATDAQEQEVTVRGTLHKLATIVEEQNPGYKCSILLVSHGRFVKGAGPSLPDDYNDAIDGFAVGPTVGSCGTAISWNVPVIVEDIQNDPLWVPFAELAKKAGVASCWSHPFVSESGRVLGALALYSPEPAAPTADQVRLLRAAAQMTGLAVERGRAEEELRSASAVKDRFMANMSHEVRTPLNALVGVAESLQEKPALALEEETRLLRESSEQLLELFTGILDLTGMQNRKHQGKDLDLHLTFRNLVGLYEDVARKRGLELELKLSDRVPNWVRVDRWAFERGLQLLLHNAVKFTSRGQVTVEVDCQGQDLLVQVRDTGCGIDLERIHELREPFVQGDLSTTKEYPGFGLGLAVGDLCVEALGAQVEFEHNEPRGTVVHLTVPIRIATAPRSEAPGPKPIERRPVSLPVLVVEDNPINSKVIERILERAGFTSQLAENGEAALRALEQDSFACVLMDCQMPVMDGYEATRRIRRLEQDTGEHIPILAVTANALADDRDKCLQAGMDEYLAKPVRKEQLVSMLREFVDAPAGAQQPRET